MILSLAILTGFQQEIRNKVFGFGGHIQISALSDNQSFEKKPFFKSEDLRNKIKGVDEVKSVQAFITKAGIVKRGKEMEGMVLKGVGSDFDNSFFVPKLISGKVPLFRDTVKNDSIIISEFTAQRLNYKCGDKLTMYFIQEPARVRKFIISGIYKTGLEEFDKMVLIGDVLHVQKLNDWNQNQIAGYEITLNDYNKIDVKVNELAELIPFDLQIESIKDLQAHIFDWLELQDINVQVILILMTLVAGINMITALLVLILENTKLIGILKSLGASNKSIQKIFIYSAFKLIAKGLIIGLVLGLSLCYLQSAFHLIKLDASAYYVEYVPVSISYMHIVVLTTTIALVCSLMLIIPSYLVSKISVVKSLRFS